MTKGVNMQTHVKFWFFGCFVLGQRRNTFKTKFKKM